MYGLMAKSSVPRLNILGLLIRFLPFGTSNLQNWSGLNNKQIQSKFGGPCTSIWHTLTFILSTVWVDWWQRCTLWKQSPLMELFTTFRSKKITLFFPFQNFFNGCEYAVDCYRYENAWTFFLLYGERDILQIWYFVQKIILTWCTVKGKHYLNGFSWSKHAKKLIKNLWCFWADLLFKLETVTISNF